MNTKLALSALVAALMLTACAKQEAASPMRCSRDHRTAHRSLRLAAAPAAPAADAPAAPPPTAPLLRLRPIRSTPPQPPK